MNIPEPAVQPTMYFIGVTTGQSSIMKVFPLWSKLLGIDAIMRGIDISIHAPAADYQAVVDFIKSDPLSRGALVTTHKMDLLAAARDRFDYVDPYGELLHEVSSISKDANNASLLRGHAKDPITSGKALEAFLPPNYWIAHPDAEALIFGAGGSSLALSLYLIDPAHGTNRPKKITVTNRSLPRLEHARGIHESLKHGVEMDFRFCPEFVDNDAVLASMPTGSLIANATGLGKDRPGSPITNDAIFPDDAFAWEFNYRGDLTFWRQAQVQKAQKNLDVQDGWVYFIHGWSQVIAEVFHLTLTDELINRLSDAASGLRPKR